MSPPAELPAVTLNSLPAPLAGGGGGATASAPLEHRCRGAEPSTSTPFLLDLFVEVDAAFQAERVRGFPISAAQQPPESASRLHAAVRSAVQRYVAAGHSDWRRLATFNDSHYVRHLVEESGNCEMMLICWKKGQASRIHNHAHSHCWLSVLSGGVEELQFTTGTSPVDTRSALEPRLPGVLSATSPCPLLMPAGVSQVGVGATAYINDQLGLHAVRCHDAACEEGEEGSVSLHIYAPPIRRVKLFEPQEDRVTLRAPGFWTIRGVEEEHLQASSHMSSSL